MINEQSSFYTRIVAGGLWNMTGNCGRKIKRFLTIGMGLDQMASGIHINFGEYGTNKAFRQSLAKAKLADERIEQFALAKLRELEVYLEEYTDVIQCVGWMPEFHSLYFAVPFYIQSAPIHQLKKLLEAIQILAASMQSYENDPLEAIEKYEAELACALP